MSKPNTDYASELHAAVKLFIDQPLNNPLTRSQIMDVARIALPILEQGESEWIEWRGGLVPPVTGLVEVRYRNGREHSGCMAGEYSWALGLGGLTIIAYRVVKS